MLLLLYIIYNLGLLHYSHMMVHLTIKTTSTCCNCNGCLNLIHRPPHHHRSTVQAFVYNILPRRKQRINIPSMTAPQQTRGCANGQKSMPLRRRRISSPIYAAARHYRHRLTCKDLPERCLAGYDAIGPQLEAYEGHRWPSFRRRRGGLPSSCVLCGEAASQLELLYVASPTSQANQLDELGDLSPNITA